MPQLRQNIVTGEWVVIAPERAKRPSDFVVSAHHDKPHECDSCPFCPGKEAHTTRYKQFDTPHLYITPNKYPAFVSEGVHEVRNYYPEKGFYVAKPATGGHEVIVLNDSETKLPQFSQEVMVDLLTSFQRRYEYYRNDSHIEYVLGFYNHGLAAGASIDHPHAQLIASSIVPNHITDEMHGSERYYELAGRCVFCEILEHEWLERVRILAENDHCLMFTFFAARFPFEIWILPKQHHSNFEEANSNIVANLAAILRQGLALLNKTLTNPSLNFFIHSMPMTGSNADYYHWHLEVAPRVANYGGFEMGGGTIIDVTTPEKAAGFLLGKE